MDKYKTRRCVSEQQDPTSQMIRWKGLLFATNTCIPVENILWVSLPEGTLIRQLCSALPCSSPQHYKILSVISLLGNYGNEESLWLGALETACRTHMTTPSRIASNMSHFSVEIQVAAWTKQRAIRNFSEKHTSAPGRETTSVTSTGTKEKKKDLVFIRVQHNPDE